MLLRSGRRGSCPLTCEDRRRLITERAMGPHLVVILTPQLKFFANIHQRKEYLYIQTFVAQTSVERFYIAVFDWSARPDEIQLYIVLISPCFHRATVKFCAIVDRDRYRCATLRHYLRKCQGHLAASQRAIRQQQQTLPRELVDHCQYPEPAPVE